jgi:hypothetical protein
MPIPGSSRRESPSPERSRLTSQGQLRSVCVVVAVILLGATGVRTDRGLTFSLPDALLLFGDYNQLRVVTADDEHVLHPAVDEGYNRGYFALPSIARQDGVIAWGFAVRWDEIRRHDKARFALGLYSRANRQWRTYGDFDDIGDAGISADGTKVAFIARAYGRLTLQILDVATGMLNEGLHLHRKTGEIGGPTGRAAGPHAPAIAKSNNGLPVFGWIHHSGA